RTVRSVPPTSALASVEDSVKAIHNDSADNNADALIAVMATSLSGLARTQRVCHARSAGAGCMNERSEGNQTLPERHPGVTDGTCRKRRVVDRSDGGALQLNMGRRRSHLALLALVAALSGGGCGKSATASASDGSGSAGNDGGAGSDGAAGADGGDGGC